MVLYVNRNGQIFGPYSVEEARGYLATGQLSKSDLVQLEGSSDWIPLAHIPGMRSAPPPPPSARSGTDPVKSEDGHVRRAEPQIRFSHVARDVFIICILTFIGGFVVALVMGGPSANPSGYTVALAVTSLFLGTTGFVISGCLTGGDLARWRHLAHVAIGTWVVSLINVFFFGISVAQWLLSSISTGLMMGIGGLLSFVLKKD